MPRHAGGRAPLVALDAGSGIPLYEQLYRGLRDLVVTGGLAPGVRVASSRALAKELGVSRFTVVGALDRLLAEGYLIGRRGSGTFVAAALPEQWMRPAAPAPPVPRTRRQRPGLSRRGEALSEVIITGPRGEREETRPFHPRRPALDVFPVEAWAALLRRHWRTCRHWKLDYGEPAGFWPLREAIAGHVSVTRGVRCSPAQVIVTSGAQQAFDLLFRLLLDPGDEAWIEEPGYLDVRAALIGSGARLVPVPMDGQGLDVAAGIRRAPSARLAVVSPAHQYPTGVTLAAPRRAALLEWAAISRAWIVEDDYDSYFRYAGRPLSALQGLDPERVVYVGTFSKTMFPSLRLGFCVVPERLVGAVANARAVAGRNSPIIDQAALAEFLAMGDYDRHLRRARLHYRERHEEMRRQFAKRLSGVVTLAPAEAGTHVLGWLNRSGLAVRVAKASAAEDLVVFPLSRYCLERPARDAMVLGYGGLTLAQIRSGVEKLGRVIEELV